MTVPHFDIISLLMGWLGTDEFHRNHWRINSWCPVLLLMSIDTILRLVIVNILTNANPKLPSFVTLIFITLREAHLAVLICFKDPVLLINVINLPSHSERPLRANGCHI